ncbi:MAG: type II secretion system protein [Planctomycetes bacterium]|nr:type II secretion system protein [Planctomycetota bacterium]
MRFHRTPAGRNTRRVRDGFTLVEATVAMAVMSIASTAALLSIAQSCQTVDSSVNSQIALGLAQQLLDEQCGKMYMVPGDTPTDTYLGPSAGEAALPGRQYNDIDDFNGVLLSPPTDYWGIPLTTDDGDGSTRDPAFSLASGYLNRFTQKATVSYVQANSPSTPITNGTTTYYRLTQIQILYNDPKLGQQTLASFSRVFSYVPAP